MAGPNLFDAFLAAAEENSQIGVPADPDARAFHQFLDEATRADMEGQIREEKGDKLYLRLEKEATRFRQALRRNLDLFSDARHAIKALFDASDAAFPLDKKTQRVDATPAIESGEVYAAWETAVKNYNTAAQAYLDQTDVMLTQANKTDDQFGVVLLHTGL